MTREFCLRSSKLHIWRTGTSILQMVLNYEWWWKGLHAITKHSTTNYWMCEGWLWTSVKLTNSLQVKVIYFFLITILKASFYLIYYYQQLIWSEIPWLNIKNLSYEESGPICASYNVLILTTPKANVLAKLVISTCYI
jgi:hypothetical protein